MFSYVARIFRALWAIICALFALSGTKDSALNVDLDVPSAVSDAEAGFEVYGALSIAQMPHSTEVVEEPQPCEQFEDPVVAESRDITFGSSLFSLGRLSTIEELEEEEDIDVKTQEAGGTEAMADIARTTREGTLGTLRDESQDISEDEDAPTSLYQPATQEYKEYDYRSEDARS